MTKDFADFLESLNREGVAYVVIATMLRDRLALRGAALPPPSAR